MPAGLVLSARNIRSYAASSGWGMAEYFAYPLMMFAAAPLFLHLLGTAQYGQWMLLLTFNGLGGLAGLGMGTATTKEVSAARGREDLHGALQSARACLSVTLVSSAGLSLALVLGGIFAGPNLLARMGQPNEVQQIILFAAALIAFEQVDTVFAGVLRGMERFDLSARVEVLSKLAIVLGSVLAAWLTRDLLIIFWITLLLTTVRCAVKAWMASRQIGGIVTPSFDRKLAGEAFAFGKWTWAQSLGAAMFATVDRLLVGGLLGAEALARYSLCLQLAQQVQTVPAAGSQFLFPMISRRREIGEDYRRLAIRASIFIGALGSALALPLILLAKPILNLWVGAEIALDSMLTLSILAVGFALLAYNVGPHYVLLGVGRAKIVATWSLAAGIVAVLCSWALIPKLGLDGAAFSRVIYALVTLATIPAMISNIANLRTERK